MSSTKGDRWERHYRNALNSVDQEKDFADFSRVGIDDVAFVELFTAVRIPSSGSATTQDLPDLHVWLRNDLKEVDQFAAEVKAGDGSVRLTNEEVEALRRYANATGSKPVVFIHIDKDSSGTDRLGGDYVVSIDDLHSTGKGYTFTKARDGGTNDACTGVTFAEWCRQPLTSI